MRANQSFIIFLWTTSEEKEYYEALFLSHRPRTKCIISQFFKTNCIHSIFRTIEARSTFDKRLILEEILRVAVCKDRESAVSDPFGESLIFCPKLALGRLFSKIIFKSSNDFVYLGNLGKIKSAVKMRSKCGFLVDQKVRWWTSAEVLK